MATTGCEAVGPGWWGQPVATATSAAFLAAGAVIWWRRRDLPTSAAVALVGVGSILAHGPRPPGAEWLHDSTLLWVLVWIILAETGRIRLWPVGLAASAVLAVTPSIADPSQALLGAMVVYLQVRSPLLRRLRLTTVGLLGIGALVGRLADGGIWCDPDSVLQGHAVWHMAAAAALTIWGVEIRPAVGSRHASVGATAG